jgi:hypothetical protein
MVEWFHIFRKVKNMSNYAVLDDNSLVTNLIVAESKTIAELITGQTCIEYFNDKDIVHIGTTTYNGSSFINPEE